MGQGHPCREHKAGVMSQPTTDRADANAPGPGAEVAFSAGLARPRLAIPPDACDCHHHIYDPDKYPYPPEDTRRQPPATVETYRLLQARLGLTRNVVVQPSAYGTDNACTLAALQQFGKTARAVVVVDSRITNAELTAMDRLGVRGIRFNIATGGIRSRPAIISLATRVAALGWHTQFWVSADDIVQLADLFEALPSQIVFDHRAHLPQPQGVRHPAFDQVSRLIDRGTAWVKLSGAYHDSRVGAPTYADTVAVGRAFVRRSPERVLWGTDWPHPGLVSAHLPWPDDAAMLDLLSEQAPGESLQRKILVENPVDLYGFAD